MDTFNLTEFLRTLLQSNTRDFPPLYDHLQALGIETLEEDPTFDPDEYAETEYKDPQLGRTEPIALVEMELPLPLLSHCRGPQTGEGFMSVHAAERRLIIRVHELTSTSLSEEENVRNLDLIHAIKVMNVVGELTTTVGLRRLCYTKGAMQVGGSSKDGKKKWYDFVHENAHSSLLMRDVGSIKLAWALQHVLDASVVKAFRSGIARRTDLTTDEGLRAAREGNACLVAFEDDESLLEKMKTGTMTLCAISYKHEMDGQGLTGLSMEQLRSIEEDLARFEYVWLDTIYSRCSKQSWLPSCLTIFAMVPTLVTGAALKSHHRTWIKAEHLMLSSKVARENDYEGTFIFDDDPYQMVILSAARRIAGGALEDTDSLFIEDKERLIGWARRAYTTPDVELSGTMTSHDGTFETLAARNHYRWSVHFSPLKAGGMRRWDRFLSPEQIIFESIDFNALLVDRGDFWKRLLMHTYEKGHCFYVASESSLYVFFGDLGATGQRLFVYDGVSVVTDGQWMRVTGGKGVTEFSMIRPDGEVLSIAMAMNSSNRFYVETPKNCSEDNKYALLKSEIPAAEYQYRARGVDMSELPMFRPREIMGHLEITLKIARHIGTGAVYRKLGTTYFNSAEFLKVDSHESLERSRN